MVEGMRWPICEKQDFVLYRGRWRLIQTDGAGDTYVQAPGETAYFIIEKYEWTGK